MFGSAATSLCDVFKLYLNLEGFQEPYPRVSKNLSYFQLGLYISCTVSRWSDANNRLVLSFRGIVWNLGDSFDTKITSIFCKNKGEPVEVDFENNGGPITQQGNPSNVDTSQNNTHDNSALTFNSNDERNSSNLDGIGSSTK